MKKILILVLLVLALGSSLLTVKSEEQLSGNVKKVIKYMESEKSGLALDGIKAFNSSEKEEFINYIKENPDKILPIYYMIMADDIFETDRDDAVFWYSFGKLRSVEDVRMCKDETAVSQIAVYGMLAPNTIDYMDTKSNQYLLEQLEKAVEKDISTPLRPDPVWACYHGLNAFSGKVRTMPKRKFEKIKKETRELYIESMKKHIKEENENR